MPHKNEGVKPQKEGHRNQEIGIQTKRELKAIPKSMEEEYLKQQLCNMPGEQPVQIRADQKLQERFP